MDALKNLLGSERGLIGLGLIICATVLAALGHMTNDDWREYTVEIFLIYAAAKTVTGTAAVIKGTAAKPAKKTTKTDGEG